MAREQGARDQGAREQGPSDRPPREWLVGGALVEAAEGVLLVQNRRHTGLHDWTPPGGVIDAGEALVDGLTREVVEETGLRVTAWHGPLWEIRVEAPGLGWHLRVEVHRAEAFEGELVLADPDGIVVDACFVAPHEAPERLAGGHPWVVDPLVEWLAAPWSGRRSYSYRVEGDDMATVTVTRAATDE